MTTEKKYVCLECGTKFTKDDVYYPSTVCPNDDCNSQNTVKPENPENERNE